MNFDYDLFVIGAGSGGVRAARMSAGFGAKVAVAEDRYYGGTCVNVGCVPKKLFVYGSHVSEDIAVANSYGWTVDGVQFDWQRLRDNKTEEIKRLNRVYLQLLEKAGVDVINGTASFVDSNTVQVGEHEYRCRHILIATGSWPFIPDIPGKEHIINSNDFFYLETLPQKAIIVGGGYIALEFASILNGLGVETHLLYRRELFLRGFDGDIRTFVRDEMLKKGVNLHFETDISEIEKNDDGTLIAHTNKGSMSSDVILYATGRKPLTEGLNLEKAGVEVDEQGAITVNEYYQSNVEPIYAIGDVIGKIQLTPVALAEGMTLARNLFANQHATLNYDYIPTAVFTQPPIATVGMMEEEAVEQWGQSDVAIYRSSFRPLKYTLGGSEERALMKLVVHRESDKVVGAHMVGPESGEIIQGFAVAMKTGATKAQFDSTIGLHPTSAEEFVTMREPV